MKETQRLETGGPKDRPKRQWLGCRIGDDQPGFYRVLFHDTKRDRRQKLNWYETSKICCGTWDPIKELCLTIVLLLKVTTVGCSLGTLRRIVAESEVCRIQWAQP